MRLLQWVGLFVLAAGLGASLADAEEERRVGSSPPLSTLSGQVTDQATGAPVSMGVVVAERRSPDEPFYRGAHLQADGDYLIEGLVPGEYRVRVLARGYLTALYTGGTRNGLVEVGVGDRIERVDVEVSKGLGVSGRVVDSGGRSVGGATLFAWPVVGDGRRQAAETAEDGTYRLTGLAPGNYLMTAAKQGYGRAFYDGAAVRDEATPVRVTSEVQPAGVNFQLKPVGTIFGRVKARTGGDPVVGALVVATPRSGGKQRQAHTGEDGAYVISNLPTADYTVRVRAESYAAQYYPNALKRQDANSVRVLSDAHTTGINLALGRLSTVSGKITDPEGKPVSGAVVFLRGRPEPGVPLTTPGRPDGAEGAKPGRVLPHHPTGRAVETEVDGTFQMKDVPPGTYALQATAVGFAARFYLKDRGTGPAEIPVGIEEVVTGMDVVLPRLGVISGRVTAVEDGALKKIEVVAVPVPRTPAAGSTGGIVDALPPVSISPSEGRDRAIVQKQFRAEILDAEKGAYRIIGLSEGAYMVRASARGYIPSWYSEADSAGAARRLEVALGQEVSKVDFALTRGGSISGYVLADRTGRPIPGAVVAARKLDRDEVWSTRTVQTGAYELNGLRDGRYLLRARARDYVAEFYGDTPKPGQAVPVVVGKQKSPADILFELTLRSPADFDGNGLVGFADLVLFVRQMMGKSQGYADAHFDLNKDGQLDFQDFLVLVRLMNGAGKIAPSSGTLVWQQLEGAADEVVAGLEAESVPASQGYVLRVVYDPMEAEYLGISKGAEGPFEGGVFLVHHDQSGSIMIAGGYAQDQERWEGQGDSRLAQFRFRPIGKAIGVALKVQRGMVITDEGIFVPLHLPTAQRMELRPRAFRLLQNVPNPFNPITTIAFELPTEARVDLAVYNLVGQRVRTLVKEMRPAGRYRVTWDSRDDFGRKVSSGIYFYHLAAGKFEATRRMLLLR